MGELVGYASLGGANTFVVPIYATSQADYDEEREQYRKSIYELMKHGDDYYQDYDSWKTNETAAQQTISGRYPSWRFNQIWGYMELFRDGHRIKAMMYRRGRKPGKPASRRNDFGQTGKSGESDLQKMDQASFKDAILEVTKQVKKAYPKQFIDLPDHLLDSLDLVRLFKAQNT